MRRNYTKLSAIALAIASLGIGAPVVSHGAMPLIPVQKTNAGQRESPKADIKVSPTVTEKENRHGRGFRVLKLDGPGMKRNQRQYRKTCRQNPCSYKSSKHRSKN